MSATPTKKRNAAAVWRRVIATKARKHGSTGSPQAPALSSSKGVFAFSWPRVCLESWPGLVLEQRLQRRERALPADANHFVIPAPPRRFLESALHDVYVRGTARLRSQGDLERHRSDGIAVRRQPERVRDEKDLADLTFHDRPPEDGAEAGEDVVVEIGRRPLNRVDPQRSAAGTPR